MDWDKVKSAAQPAADAPAATLVEVSWQARTPTGRVITCGIYTDSAPGFEVRAQLSDDDLLRSERVREIGKARELAATWKQAALAKGGFAEVKGGA